MSYSSCFLFVKIVVVIWWWVLTYFTPLITGDNKIPQSHVIAPYCSDRCGNVSIPYPFGIEDGCFYNDQNDHSSFDIYCNHTTNPPTPIFGTNVEVLDISVEKGELILTNYVAFNCYNQSGGSINSASIELSLRQFTLSSTNNILVATGCDTYAWFKGQRNDKNYSSGCMTTCVQPDDVIDGECSGVGCCEASFPSAAQNINITAKSFNNHILVYEFNPCSVAFPVEKNSFKFQQQKYMSQAYQYYDAMKQPLVIDWTIGNKSCSEAKADGSCLCKQNAECHDAKHKGGYRCKCKAGYFW